MSKPIQGIAALIVWFVCALPAPAQKPILGEWMVPKVKAGEYPIRRVIVLPSQFTLTKDTMKGRQSLETENLKHGPAIDKAIVAVLQKMGLPVVAATLDAPGVSAELRASTSSLQQGFDSVTPLMFRKPKEVRKGRYRVDEQVIGSISAKDVAKQDAVLFVRGSGGRQTKAKAFAMGGGVLGAAMAGGLRINVVLSFVDAVTGEVLYVRGGILKIHDENTEEHLVKDLENWLKDGKGKYFGGAT